MNRKLPSNIDIAKSNEILCTFIGFVQSKNLNEIEKCSEKDCVRLLDWLSTKQINVNKKDWYQTEDGNVIPQLLTKTNKIMHNNWVYELRSMMQILLKSNGNIKFVDENGKTILHVFLEDYLKTHRFERASSGLRIQQMVAYLMDKGISIDAADINGNTPLHIAAKLIKEHIDVDNLMQIMLQNYSNINACNGQGDTVLHILCDSAYLGPDSTIEFAESMLARGADVNLQNEMGWAAAHIAVKNSDLFILDVLLKGKANLQLFTNDGENPVMIFCKYRTHEDDMSTHKSTKELIKLLIGTGCDVNAIDRDGYSPLHYACKNCSKPTRWVMGSDDILCIPPSVCLLDLLVKEGADVNAETADGETPLLLAVLPTSCEFMEYLCEKGAKVSCREMIFGFTPLHMAALQFDKTKIEFCLRQGLDVNDGGYYGITALHLASFRGNLEFMRMLLASGADVHCRDKVTRSTPLHFVAKEGSILEHISLICDVKRKPFWNPHLLTVNRSEGAISLLVQHGAEVNARDARGRTPLHLATMFAEEEPIEDSWVMGYAQSKEISKIRGLLTCGAHMDVQDDEGNTPLHNALKTGHESAFCTLLQFDVDVNEPDTSRIVLSCEENLKDLSILYLIILRAAQLPVSDAYGLPIVNPKVEDFYGRCTVEVKKMKDIFIDDTTSIYDLLHMGWRRRLSFVQKLPTDLGEKFPLYAGIIQNSCHEAEQRKPLLEHAKLGWYRITEVKLPDICVERILAHLKNRYLIVLAEGLSDDS